MIPDLALWIIAIALGIIALPTLLVILIYGALGMLLGVYKFVEVVRGVL